MYLHLWNTWKGNESSQIEEVDFGSKDIYIFFPFSLFVSVYVYASLCDFVCIALLSPFVLGFCPSVFFCLFVCFLLKKIFFLIIIFYFNNFILFYFTLFYFIYSSFFLSFFLSIFSPFYSEPCGWKLLVLQLGIRAVPLRWESQLQDTGPQETSQLHIISNGENLPEISISTPRPSFTQRLASYSAGHPMPNN